MQVRRSSEFGWLLSQVKPFVRLHLGSYLWIAEQLAATEGRPYSCSQSRHFVEHAR